MARTWVLDTETKGTGAEVVPLDKARAKRGPQPALNLVQLHASESAETSPEPDEKLARRFKVVDLLTRQTLAQDVGIRQAISVLGGVRSIVDVNVFVWQPQAERWRLLSLDEQRALWDRR